MEPPRSTRKIRKTQKFNNKKALIKHILDIDSDLEQYVLHYDLPLKDDKKNDSIQDKFPLRFSTHLKSPSIDIIDQGKTATVNSLGREGAVLLDFPLREKTSWQLQMCLISHNASFGITAVKDDFVEGIPPLSESYIIGKGDKMGQFQFENNQLIQLTYDPKKMCLGFFNTKSIKSCFMDIPPLQQGYHYWPVVLLHKCTVFLKQDYLLKRARQEQKK